MIDRCNSHSRRSHLIQCGLTDGEVFDLQRRLAGLQLVKNVSHTSGSYRDVILHHGRVMILEGKAGDSARATPRSKKQNLTTFLLKQDGVRLGFFIFTQNYTIIHTSIHTFIHTRKDSITPQLSITQNSHFSPSKFIQKIHFSIVYD